MLTRNRNTFVDRIFPAARIEAGDLEPAVVVDDGRRVRAMRIPTDFEFACPDHVRVVERDGKETHEIHGHGGNVGGSAGDFLVLLESGDFTAMTSREVVTEEDQRRLEAEAAKREAAAAEAKRRLEAETAAAEALASGAPTADATPAAPSA